MKVSKLLLMCLCCVLAVPAVWGQAADSAAKGILGYLDPSTGTFRLAAPAIDENGDPTPATVFTGTVNLTITVTLKTTGLTSISCTANTNTEDALTTTTPRAIAESDTVLATGTGTTRTCKLSIPYSWSLTTQASDTMSTSYTVNGAATTTGTPPLRSSTLSPVDSRKVPASGAITTLTANVTL